MSNPATIAELAITMPRAIPVLQRLRIDYCCSGSQTIEQACTTAGITPEKLIALVDAEPASGAARNWDDTTCTEIIRFVVDTHHAYTRQSVETLQWMSAKVANRHGEGHPELLTLARLVGQLCDDLLPHMMKEEQILFPYVEQLEAGDSAQPFFGTARNPIHMMMLEHETVGDLLKEMRSLTKDYLLPEGACTTFTAYFNLLQEFETDLHNHIHLENNILFPRSIALEENEPAMTGAGR